MAVTPREADREIIVTIPGVISESASVTRIPLKRAGNLFLIEAQIDSMRGNFILDLGAPYLVLNSTYFRDYAIDLTSTSQGVVTGTEYVKWTRVDRLAVRGLEFRRLSADIINLGAIENRRGIQVLGLMGVSLFEEFVFELDVDRQQLVLHRDAATVRAASRPVLDTPIRLRNDVITVKASVNGIELNLSLDSAAEANVLHNDLPPGVYAKMRILGNSVLRDAAGGATEVITAEIPATRIETLELKSMKTLILNLNALKEAYGRSIQGMLGYPFFSSGRTVIDFKAKRLMQYPKDEIQLSDD